MKIHMNNTTNYRLALYVPETHPRGVIEKFITGEIEITNFRIDIENCELDYKGKLRFANYSKDIEIETVLGYASLSWKSNQDRLTCADIQKRKNKKREGGKSRWTEILSMTEAIKNEQNLPLPLLVHPTLHGASGLMIIDGARRILANVEAKREFVVAITKQKEKIGDITKPYYQTYNLMLY